MPDLPIIPVGPRPNLSRTDRIEPQRVEPAFASSMPSGMRGVEGATLESDLSRSVRTGHNRHGAGPTWTRRGLRHRVSPGRQRPPGGRGGGNSGRECNRGCIEPAGPGRALGIGVTGRHPAGGGARAGGSGPRACRDSRHGSRLGDTGRRTTAHRIAHGFANVRHAGRGDFRRNGTAPVPGGSGL
jgi:hypothetical protein